METLWLGDWEKPSFFDTSLEEMTSDFDISLEGVENINIIVAYYGYEGEALVIFEESGALHMVSAYHCSCYGLEGQWTPVAVTREYLHHIIEDGYFVEEINDEIVSRLSEYLNIASETFKDLGFAQIDTRYHTVFGKENAQYIKFSKKDRVWDTNMEISPVLFRAIELKMKELGWLGE